MTSGSPLERERQEVAVDSPSPVLGPLRLPSWRFWLPLAIQSLFILTVPAQDMYTYATGRPVTLQTVPVDPYDFLRGYSQTLSYDISDPEALKKLPGGSEVFTANRAQGDLYVTLEAPAGVSNPPRPWNAIAVSQTRPEQLAANQVVLKGQYRGWRVLYGLETYYMPEDQRDQLNQRIGQMQRQNQRAFVVDIKVDAQGNSVPVSLWIEKQNYRF